MVKLKRQHFWIFKVKTFYFMLLKSVLMLYWVISHCMIKVWQRCDFQSVAAISLRSFVTYYNGSFTFYHNFCNRKSLRVYHGNDMIDNVFSLGGIVLLWCCGRASTTTCYCQYIHNMLLWTCKKYCCCTYNIYEITPIYYIHESSRSRYIQVELGKVEGFWSMLQLLQQALAENLKVKHRSSLAADTKRNQSAVPCDNVIMSDRVWTHQTAPSRVSWQTSGFIYILYYYLHFWLDANYVLLALYFA